MHDLRAHILRHVVGERLFLFRAATSERVEVEREVREKERKKGITLTE